MQNARKIQWYSCWDHKFWFTQICIIEHVKTYIYIYSIMYRSKSPMKVVSAKTKSTNYNRVFAKTCFSSQHFATRLYTVDLAMVHIGDIVTRGFRRAVSTCGFSTGPVTATQDSCCLFEVSKNSKGWVWMTGCPFVRWCALIKILLDWSKISTQILLTKNKKRNSTVNGGDGLKLLIQNPQKHVKNKTPGESRNFTAASHSGLMQVA